MSALHPDLQRGLEALDQDQPETALEALAGAESSLGENHPGVLHLRGLIEWARGDLDRAGGYLLQASDDAEAPPEASLDCAELLLSIGEEIEEAGATLVRLLDRDSVEAKAKDQARVLLAQVKLDQEPPDPQGALGILDQVEGALAEDSYYASTRGAVLLTLDRADEAIALLRGCLEKEDDSELRYQLAITLRSAGKEDAARDEMARVLQADQAEDENLGQPDEVAELPYEEVHMLRNRVEELFEELPDPLLKRVAHAPIRIQMRPSLDQVAGGLDARALLALTGEPDEDDLPELEAVVVMRNLVAEEVEDEEEVVDALLPWLIEEFRRFFGMDDLVVAGTEG